MKKLPGWGFNIIIISVWLIACFVVGRITHPAGGGQADSNIHAETGSVEASAGEKKAGSSKGEVPGAVSDQDKAGSEEGKEIWEGFPVSFDDSYETTDNPWGFSSGLIENDKEGTCILLTPDTTADIYVEYPEVISFEFLLHPWVANGSDGAMVIVQLQDDDGETIYQEKVTLGSTKREQYTVDIESYPKCRHIVLGCSSAPSGNRVNDWLLVKRVPLPDPDSETDLNLEESSQ